MDQITEVSQVAQIILEEHASLVTQTKDWPSIFRRLNATALSMQYSIFQSETAENKSELNMLSQILSININMIHSLIENQEIDDGEIPEEIKNIFRLHIEFETFIFTKFVERVNETDDFEEIQDFLKDNFADIYSDIDFKQLILNFSEEEGLGAMETPRKLKTKSSRDWSNRGSHSNNFSKRSNFGRSGTNGETWDFNKQSTLGPSTNKNSMTFKKKSQPQEMIEEQENAAKEDEFPDYREVSIKTDSELEELNKNKQQFQLMNNRSSKERMFADVLGFDDQDSSHVASR